MPYCPRNDPFIKNDPQRRSPFEPLTAEEMNKVFETLKDNKIIDVSHSLKPNIRANYVYSMMLYHPNKADALNHLDHGDERPSRYAEVFVTRGASSPPDIMKYKVGPLDQTTVNVVEISTPGTLHYNTRSRDSMEEEECYKILLRELQKLKPMLEESFDGASFPDSIVWFPIAPPGLRAAERETNIQLGFKVEGLAWWDNLIHNLPVELTIHNPGPDPSFWRLHSFYYLNQGPFASVDELLSAYQNNTINKIRLPSGYRSSLFERTVMRQRSTTARPFSDQAPPITFEPSGPRYKIEGYTVKWMGWEFTITSGQMRGPSLYNIKFQGERIVYENSLQDIALLYAGDSK